MQLAAYLAEQAATLKVATLTRRLAAISIAHKAQRLPSPVSSPLVRATMRGVRREHGTAQRQAAPLLREDLFIVPGAMAELHKAAASDFFSVTLARPGLAGLNGGAEGIRTSDLRSQPPAASRFSLYGFVRRSDEEEWRESRFAVIANCRLTPTPAVR
jgi:hypothetical protein